MSLFTGRDSAYNDHSDAEIIASYLRTDNNYFVGLLYRRYGHLVLGLCLKYLKNRMEAEDAVMQIYSKLLDDLKKHTVSHFKSWLYVYSKNHCLMELRKRQSALKKELELKDDVLVMDLTVSTHLQEREQQLLLLEQAIEDLNENQKICIKLFYLHNCSYAEVASRTGYSLNEVKSHIQNGKRNLKLMLEAKTNEGAEDQER